MDTIHSDDDALEGMRHERLLAGQNHILEMIASGVNLFELLKDLILFMEKESGRVLGSVLLLDPDGKALRTGAGPSLPPEYTKLVDGLVPGPYNGSCGTAVYNKEIVIVPDTLNDPHWEKYKEVAAKFGLRACTSIPIFGSNRQILGTFAFYYLTPAIPNEYELKLIEVSSALAGIAIEKHNTEKTLLENEELYRLITENISDLIAVLGLNGDFIYSSPSYYNVLGFNSTELKSKNLFDLIHPDDVGAARAFFNKAISGEESVVVVRSMHVNGSWRWIDRWAKRITRQGENCILIVGRDVTERKATEEIQKLLTEALRKQNEDLHQFSYITSHNLRGPIASILGLVNLLSNTSGIEDAKVLLEHLKKSADNLDAVIKDLNEINIYRSSVNENRQIISFQDLVSEVKSNLQKQIQKSNAEITVDFSSAPEIYSVLSYVHNILFNLLDNAIRYRSPDRILKIRIETSVEDDFVCLSVTDNGLGIDLTKQGNKIFGFYKRFHSHVEGKGLGLYLVKTQIESLGGRIEVESEPEKETRFSVYFKNNQ